MPELESDTLAKQRQLSRLHWPVRITSPAELTHLDHLLVTWQPDVVVAEHPTYADLGPWAQRRGVPLVLSAQNFESGLAGFRSTSRSVIDHAMVWGAEALYLRKVNTLWTISQTDADDYVSAFGVQRVDVIPFSVPLPARLRPASKSEGRRRTVLFVGSFSWTPNVRAARFLACEVVPILRRRSADVRFVFAGRHPPSWLRNLESDDIHVPGAVPDLAPMYDEAHLVVAPESVPFGVKTKVLEAMAHAKAVLTTDAGVRGIKATHMIHYVGGPWHPEGYANALQAALSSTDKLKEIGTNARLLIEQFHSAEATARAIDDSLNDLR